jgi:hypothetical protein
MRIDLKLDITTGDVIIPREVDYAFKLMFDGTVDNRMAQHERPAICGQSLLHAVA